MYCIVLTVDNCDGLDGCCCGSWFNCGIDVLEGITSSSSLFIIGNVEDAAVGGGSGPVEGVKTLLSAKEPVYSSLSQSSGEGKPSAQLSA